MNKWDNGMTYDYTRASSENNGTGTSGAGRGDAAVDRAEHSKRVANARRILAASTDTRSATAKTTGDVAKSQFVFDVWDVMDEAGNLLLRKHEDYGPTNISRSPGGPLNGLRVRMWDKVARINNLIDNDIDPNHESLRDSFIDLLNYSAIAIMVLENKWPEK
jgi:hypothetical protein